MVHSRVQQRPTVTPAFFCSKLRGTSGNQYKKTVKLILFIWAVIVPTSDKMKANFKAVASASSVFEVMPNVKFTSQR